LFPSFSLMASKNPCALLSPGVFLSPCRSTWIPLSFFVLTPPPPQTDLTVAFPRSYPLLWWFVVKTPRLFLIMYVTESGFFCERGYGFSPLIPVTPYTLLTSFFSAFPPTPPCPRSRRADKTTFSLFARPPDRLPNPRGW